MIPTLHFDAVLAVLQNFVAKKQDAAQKYRYRHPQMICSDIC
jgi:hypothetical protein